MASSLPRLYSKTATGAINVWQCWTEGPYVVTTWGQIDGKMQTSRFECEPKNVGRSNATTAEEQAIKEAEALWKKQKKKKYFETLEAAEEGKGGRLKPMLAQKWEDHKHKVKYPATMQPKLDGVRCFAFWKEGDVYLQSRGGDPYEMEHVKKVLRFSLPRGMVLDGELYSHGVSLQTLNSLVRRPRYPMPEAALQTVATTELFSDAVTYCVYDATQSSKAGPSWPTRMRWLSTFFESSHLPPHAVWPVPSVTVTDEVGVRSTYEGFIQAGYEGAMIRTHEGTYRFGYRSPHLLKMKEWQDAEFRIVGWTIGKGKFSQVPIFKCITNEGKEFDVAPKGTEEERKQMLSQAPHLVGKLLKVKFFDWTNDRIPHFPVGLGVRDAGDL